MAMGSVKQMKELKIVAMVPARTGSKRIKSKNLRFLAGKPLIAHVLSTIAAMDIFDGAYLNSNGTIFSGLAEEYGFTFFHRSEELANDQATNDAFAYDFLKSVECDYLVQILPTSPFISADEIYRFVTELVSKRHDGLISVVPQQIACIYKGHAINFDKDKVNPPSQEMEPVYSYATTLMGWKRDVFMRNYEELGVAYHCPRGDTGYFPLEGLATIDIDNEPDFVLAEAIALAQKHIKHSEPEYYPTG